jgi:hypothetical protein
MPISVQCPGCGAKFRSDDKLAGRRGKCPKCAIQIQVGNVVQKHNAQPATPAAKVRETSAPVPSQCHAVPDDTANDPLSFLREERPAMGIKSNAGNSDKGAGGAMDEPAAPSTGEILVPQDFVSSLEVVIREWLGTRNRMRAMGECRVQLDCDFDTARRIVQLIETLPCGANEIRDAVQKTAAGKAIPLPERARSIGSEGVVGTDAPAAETTASSQPSRFSIPVIPAILGGACAGFLAGQVARPAASQCSEVWLTIAGFAAFVFMLPVIGFALDSRTPIFKTFATGGLFFLVLAMIMGLVGPAGGKGGHTRLPKNQNDTSIDEPTGPQLSRPDVRKGPP